MTNFSFCQSALPIERVSERTKAVLSARLAEPYLTFSPCSFSV